MTQRCCRRFAGPLLIVVGTTVAVGLAAARQGETATEQTWLPATPQKLPRWRGFNLTEKFHRDWSNKPFVEEDFRLIRELGFNFVRLPMDYRVWIQGNDWTRFNEAALREIDQAVEWGGKYGIHVMINFHRAPGYTVASPPEERVLWTDAEAQRVCALHWATFARRYRGIPNERLSFNLFNEPSGVSKEEYVAVVKPIVAAIRQEDPNRLIVSDGLQWGQQPVLELAPLGLAQATRGYAPTQLTHYKASWVTGADRFPLPTWPMILASGTLYSPAKQELKPESRQPMIIDGPFPTAAALRLHVLTVSSRARLVVRADGKTVWEKEFVCGPGEGEWKEARLVEPWKIYQNVFDRDYEAPIPAHTAQVEVLVTDGDWLRLSEIGLRRPD
ncbi:MAG: cellulase family glycosylhydrolase, partial [Armatimonadota bacterium]|nr:cellulase family glycosylhydrolase [Armatimonadota bacterium]